MRAVCLSAVLIAHLAVATVAAATPHAGSRDLSFGHNGRVVLNLPGEGMRPSAIAVQSDGKIVIAGTLTASSNTYPGWLRGVPVTVRLLPNGRLDSTYGAGGISRVAFDGSVTIQGLAIQPDGALLLSGIASPAPGKARGAMARLQPSGAVDRTFGSEGLVTFSQSEADRGYATGVQSMSRLAVMPDGRIVAAGSQESVDVHRNSDPLVARLTPDGGLDSTFGKHGLASYGPERPTAVVVRPDGEVVIVGVSDDYFGGTDLSVSPLNPGPSSRPAYEHYRYSLTGATASAQPDGSVLFIGNIEAAGVRTYLTWAEVGENGLVERAKVRTSGVQAATVDARGAILTAGPWLTGRDSPLYFIERYRHRRRLDRSFGDADGDAVIRIKSPGPAQLIGMVTVGETVLIAGVAPTRKLSGDEPVTIYRLQARQDDAGPRIAVNDLPRRDCLTGVTRIHIRVRDESRTRTRVRVDGRSLATSSRTHFTAPLDATTLTSGRHRLTLRAADAAGNVGAREITIRACG